MLLRFLCGLIVLVAALVSAAPGRAHPHVFADVSTELVVDATGRLTALRHRWTFDDVYSAFARQGLDTNRDGVFSREELQGLAEVNVTSVSEFAYFTFVLVDGQARPFGAPSDYWLENDGRSGQLTLHFTLPLREPLDLTARPALVKVFDPEYFVAFEFVAAAPARLAPGAPPACRIEAQGPQDLDEATAARLAQIPASQRQLPSELAGLTAALSNDIALDCSGQQGPLLAALGVATATPGAGGGGQRGLADLPALVTDGTPQPTELRAEPGFFASFFGRMIVLQAEVYRTFGQAVRAVGEDPWALFALLGLAFGYGVLHAAGPGHGKIVISSYLLATRETLRRGIVIAFASALVQGAVAIVLVGVLALIVEATSRTMTRVAGVVEIVSYALVVVFGAYLLARKLAVFLPERRPATLSAAAAGHAHGAACDHDHAPDPRLLAGPFDWRTALAAVLAVGLRPCTGALLVLVFALSQGVFVAGFAAVLAMSLGTGLAVAILASIAVGAKALAVRLAARRSDAAIALGHGIEAFGALLVFGFGLLLLTAALLHGPMGG